MLLKHNYCSCYNVLLFAQMDTFFTTIINSISIPDAGMALHVFSILLLAGCIFAIISNRKLISSFSYKRALNSFLFVVFFQILLLIGHILLFRGNIQFEPYQNISIKIVFGISSLWLIWLWCFPSSAQSADGIKYALTIAFIIIFITQLFIITATDPPGKAMNFYNEAMLVLLIFIILFSGFLLILINHKPGWFWGLLFVAFLTTGMLFSQTPVIDSASRPGILCLTQFVSFIFLPPIVQSLIFGEISPDKKQTGYRLPIANKDMRILPSMDVYKSWLNLTVKNQDSLILEEFLKNFAKTFQADFCFLISPIKPKQKSFSIYAGYSLEKSNIEFPIILDSSTNITLYNHLKNGKPGIVNTEDYLSEDISNLLRFLKIKQPIHILFYPIRTRLQPKNIFGLALISSQTRWDRNHLRYLSGLDDELVQIMQKVFPKKIGTIRISSSDPEQPEDKTLQLTRISEKENQTQKISRLESELKLALEEYSRIKRLLEERNILGDFSNKSK